MNHKKDILKIVPGIGFAKIALNQYISSIGKVGKSALTITIAKLRTINIVPRVAINEGIPNLIVIVAFIKPITKHIKRAIVNAKWAFTPSFVKTTITTPLNAKTDPTDKSNSPDTIRIVAPIAIKAISGEIVRRTRRFLKFKKFSLIA